MQALDGNAIAGVLFDYFGSEMTAERGSCANCGASALIGELPVYLAGPGAVVRCRSCQSVLMVVFTLREIPRVEMAGFALDAA